MHHALQHAPLLRDAVPPARHAQDAQATTS
jgi:hypothetical protein